jgi:hypothetical protein
VTAVTSPSATGKPPSPIKNEPAPRNRLIPAYRGEFDPEAFVGTQALARMRDVALTWWGVFESMHESDSYGVDRKGTLPQWARDLIGSYKQQHAAHAELSKWADMANVAMRLSEGKQVPVFEVWSKRAGRLDGQHTFWAQAEARKQELIARFPDAYVVSVHPKSPMIFPESAEMLDTMIGRVFWCGVGYGDNDEPDFHTVQDSTGRTATVPADVLISHAVFQQLSADGQQQVALHEEHAQRRRERRVAAKDE